jgi:hypothetical protein
VKPPVPKLDKALELKVEVWDEAQAAGIPGRERAMMSRSWMTAGR